MGMSWDPTPRGPSPHEREIIDAQRRGHQPSPSFSGSGGSSYRGEDYYRPGWASSEMNLAKCGPDDERSAESLSAVFYEYHSQFKRSGLLARDEVQIVCWVKPSLWGRFWNGSQLVRQDRGSVPATRVPLGYNAPPGALTPAETSGPDAKTHNLWVLMSEAFPPAVILHQHGWPSVAPDTLWTGPKYLSREDHLERIRKFAVPRISETIVHNAFKQFFIFNRIDQTAHGSNR